MAAAPQLFTIHGMTANGREATKLVPHRFAWAAFWLGPIWLLAKRLWLAGALVSLIGVAIGYAARSGFLSVAVAVAAWLLLSTLIGLEGHEWLRRAASQRGAPLVGFGYGLNEADAIAYAAFYGKIGRSERVGS